MSFEWHVIILVDPIKSYFLQFNMICIGSFSFVLFLHLSEFVAPNFGDILNDCWDKNHDSVNLDKKASSFVGILV